MGQSESALKTSSKTYLTELDISDMHKDYYRAVRENIAKNQNASFVSEIKNSEKTKQNRTLVSYTRDDKIPNDDLVIDSKYANKKPELNLETRCDLLQQFNEIIELKNQTVEQMVYTSIEYQKELDQTQKTCKIYRKIQI